MSVEDTEDKQVYELTITADDKIIALIEEHTRYTSHAKSTNNILKCITLIAHGTPKAAACRTTGISRHTLNRWAREDWYNECIQLIRDKLDEELDASLTGVVHKAASEVMERLEHGDWVWDKQGNMVRKPIGAREAMLVGGIAFDKRNLQRGKPTSISETVSEDDRLANLAAKFREMAIDVDYETIPSQTEQEESVEDSKESVGDLD